MQVHDQHELLTNHIAFTIQKQWYLPYNSLRDHNGMYIYMAVVCGRENSFRAHDKQLGMY